MPTTRLEDKLNSEKGIGLRILNLIKKKRMDSVAELAYQEFGLERALRILVNNGYGLKAGLFAESKGYKEKALRLYIDLGIKSEALRLAEELNLPIDRADIHKKPPKWHL